MRFRVTRNKSRLVDYSKPNEKKNKKAEHGSAYDIQEGVNIAQAPAIRRAADRTRRFW
jgi:hypothetical protein